MVKYVPNMLSQLKIILKNWVNCVDTLETRNNDDCFYSTDPGVHLTSFLFYMLYYLSRALKTSQLCKLCNILQYSDIFFFFVSNIVFASHFKSLSNLGKKKYYNIYIYSLHFYLNTLDDERKKNSFNDRLFLDKIHEIA